MRDGFYSSGFLAARSALWAILLPGMVAGYVPWRYFGLGRAPASFGAAQAAGLLCIGVGSALLVACIVEFARRGRGTLSPLDPPRRLVVRGLYRYVRNPMYLSVTIIVLGEALWIGSRTLAIYWAIWFAAAHLFVVGYEEPNLRERFGSSYNAYARRVRRWIPSSRPAEVSPAERRRDGVGPEVRDPDVPTVERDVKRTLA
jgi:protein-S-isoprenylcysteine O-methyltransferase Ste14